MSAPTISPTTIRPPAEPDIYASSMQVSTTGGVWTAVPIPEVCVCGGRGGCLRCAIDDEADWKRRSDA
jgi:hypothetical protein